MYGYGIIESQSFLYARGNVYQQNTFSNNNIKKLSFKFGMCKRFKATKIYHDLMSFAMHPSEHGYDMVGKLEVHYFESSKHMPVT